MRIRGLMTGLLALVAAMNLLATSRANDEAVKKDLAALQGSWAIVSAVRDGKEVTDKTVTLTFDATGRATVKKGDQVLMTGPSKIDPTKKPKTYDVTQDSPGEANGKTFPGIYELDGDTLKVCSAGPGKERPTELSSKPGSGHFLRVYQRAKN